MGLNVNAGAQMFYTRPSDGATYCFSPVPLISESKEFLRTANNETRLGIIHEVTFNGTLLPAIPALSGVSTDASCLELLDRKSDQLCSALEDRGDLLIVDSSGYPVIAERPTVVSLTFDESSMVHRRDYTLVFSYESEFDGGFVREYDESWSFEQQDGDQVSVQHTVSAIGLTDADGGTNALANARAFVLGKITPSGTVDKSLSSVMKAPFVPALIDIDGYTSVNHVLSEQVGITDGSYEVTETWLLASGLFQDDRTIEITFEPDEFGALRSTTNINGTVQGYGTTTFDKFANAQNGFNNFVSPQIGFSDASGVQTKSTTENRIAGTVNYSINRVPADDSQLDSRSISRQIDRQEDGSVVQSVTTSATIRAGSTSGIELAIAFCFANNFPIDSVEPLFTAALSGNLISVSTTRDDVARSFSLTRGYQDQATSLFREEYTVERQENVDTSVTTITVGGTVFGMGVESSTKSKDRFASASGAFFGPGGIGSVIRTRALAVLPSGTCISDGAISETLSLNEFAGTINYSQSFDSRFKTSNDKVLSEQIEVTFSPGAQVIAIIPIPGKSDGPILQDQETVTGLEKSLNITYSMKRDSVGCDGDTVIPNNLLLSDALAESDILVNNTPIDNSRGEKPVSGKVFKTADQYTWNRQTLSFTRNVKWQYI